MSRLILFIIVLSFSTLVFAAPDQPSTHSKVLKFLNENVMGRTVTVKAEGQLEPASFGKEQGSGLGFSHARKHIESWDGVLELTSEEGIGTEVKIWLPISPSE